MLILGVIFLLVAAVVSLVGSVMLAVAAFRESVVWGVCVLLVPFAAFVFIIMHWESAKRGVLVSLGSVACALVGFGMVTSAAPRALAKQLESQATSVRIRTANADAARPSLDTATTAPAVYTERAPSRDSSTDASTALASARSLAPDTYNVIPAGPPPVLDIGEITPATLHKHIGRELLFFQQDGRRIAGKLLAVNARTLRVERYMSGGSVNYEIPRGEITEVRAVN